MASVNKLYNALHYIYPFRKQLMSLLRPMDITALHLATGIPLYHHEQRDYMVWWRQIFFDLDWVKAFQDNNETVTIIGEHLRRLDEGLRSGTYGWEAGSMRFVIVLGGKHDAERAACVMGSIDGETVYKNTTSEPDAPHPFVVDQVADEIHVLVISGAAEGSCIELDRSWTDALCSRHGTLGKYPVGHGKPYPSSFDVWQSEWQQLNTYTSYNPTRIRYLVECFKMDEYRIRLLINSKLTCSSLLMRISGHEEWNEA
ncbi:uncharacterized protein PAC_05610 [Phialocephala subalpina]|uniref:Uncharacterized protein n=1 Tax=Phialocephala subalpina TaxID=576137 RepID=A0A1L7WSH3_9HELO|nr:uncharacterized protein PAC_05610 [Phialocephala subalpina]